MTREEVVVLGIGAASPFGLGCGPLWDGIASSATGIRPLELFDVSEERTHIAGAVPGAPEALPHERPLTRVEWLALSAADEALEGAGLRQLRASVGSEIGVYWGSSTGAMREGEIELLEPKLEPGLSDRSRFEGQPIGTVAGLLASRLGSFGAVETIASACSASTMAIHAAMLELQAGGHEIVLAGGADSLCRVTYSGFNSLRALCPQPARPFRLGRNGLSLGEGAGALVLATRGFAERQGIPVMARLTGAASTCDAYHMTAPEPSGARLADAMDQALAQARLTGGEVGAVVAHGTGTPHNDAAEARAFARLFGPEGKVPPVLAPKGAVGHLLGAAGALEAVLSVLCLVHGVVPCSAGDGEIDPDAMAPVGIAGGPARPLLHPVVVSVNLAFGGANCALVFEVEG